MYLRNLNLSEISDYTSWKATETEKKKKLKQPQQTSLPIIRRLLGKN